MWVLVLEVFGEQFVSAPQTLRECVVFGTNNPNAVEIRAA